MDKYIANPINQSINQSINRPMKRTVNIQRLSTPRQRLTEWRILHFTRKHRLVVVLGQWVQNQVRRSHIMPAFGSRVGRRDRRPVAKPGDLRRRIAVAAGAREHELLVLAEFGPADRVGHLRRLRLVYTRKGERNDGKIQRKTGWKWRQKLVFTHKVEKQGKSKRIFGLLSMGNNGSSLRFYALTLINHAIGILLHEQWKSSSPLARPFKSNINIQKMIRKIRKNENELSKIIE